MNEIENKLNKIAIFGPHDRMNYGDFLFPIVIDYCFSSIVDRDIVLKKYSLIKSDFTHIGAFKSENYKKMIKDINGSRIDFIIIAGGECLGATWEGLYYFINPKLSKTFNYIGNYLPRKYNYKLLKFLSRKILGGISPYPFSMSRKLFKNPDVKFFYNSVGGGYRVDGFIMRDLKDASVLNVRDDISYTSLKKKNIKAKVSPDSVVMLSKIFPKKDLVPLIGKDYIVFQISILSLKDEYEHIANELKLIYKKYNYKIILLPIGTASGHEDDKALNKFQDLLKFESILIKQPDIPSIINIIANGKVFIGTSLHGIITAMNYGVPYVGLDYKIKKQKSYIETWSIKDLKFSYLDEKLEMFQLVERLISSDLNVKIKEQNDRNQKIYLENFQEIFDVIKKSN